MRCVVKLRCLSAAAFLCGGMVDSTIGKRVVCVLCWLMVGWFCFLFLLVR